MARFSKQRNEFAARVTSLAMSPPIQLISTDFDGTLHAEFETPPVPLDLQRLIGDLQRQGAQWVINTGRDLSSLLETMARAHLGIKPDWIVTVEREIYRHKDSSYVGVPEWNLACTRDHDTLFARVREDLPRLTGWVNERHTATVYEDPYSPFCLIAEDVESANAIQFFLEEYCGQVPRLTVVRNDVYARFSHEAYNKGTALGEISRLLGLSRDVVFVAGDHYNDLPMLDRAFARWIVAPVNAIDAVKVKVREQGGYVSHQPCGHGVARGLEFCLETK